MTNTKKSVIINTVNKRKVVDFMIGNGQVWMDTPHAENTLVKKSTK